MSDECACRSVRHRTDYGTGVEYDVDRGACPIHGDPVTADDTAREALPEAMRVRLATHCNHCFRPLATEADWENTDEGERPDLCWEDPANCGWVPDRDLPDFLAEALLPVVREAQAEAWERGRREWNAGHHRIAEDGEPVFVFAPNPYRADRVTRGSARGEGGEEMGSEAAGGDLRAERGGSGHNHGGDANEPREGRQ